MTKVQLPKETFEQVLNVITQLPYAQVAQLLQEVGANMEEVDGTNSIPDVDGSNGTDGTDGRSSGVDQPDKE